MILILEMSNDIYLTECEGELYPTTSTRSYRNHEKRALLSGGHSSQYKEVPFP